MKAKLSVDRTNAERIRTKIIQQGGRGLWEISRKPENEFGMHQYIVAYALAGRVVLVYEFWRESDDRSCPDVYVPLTDTCPHADMTLDAESVIVAALALYAQFNTTAQAALVGNDRETAAASANAAREIMTTIASSGGVAVKAK